MNNTKFIGKWAKEGYREGEEFIEFTLEKGSIVKRGNYENLQLHKEADGQNSHTFHFSHMWPGKDENVLLEFQSHYVEKPDPSTGTFINAQEFRLLDDNKIQYKLMGYRLDAENEKWVHFENVIVLKKIS